MTGDKRRSHGRAAGRIRILIPPLLFGIALSAASARGVFGAPRVVMAELFTSALAPNCPAARCGLHRLVQENPESLIMIDHHLFWSGTDPFYIPQVEVRFGWYGYHGVAPVAIFDGLRDVVGAQGGCDGAYARYMQEYGARMAETGGESPVSIEGFWCEGTFHATFRLEQGTLPDPLQATFFLYEDSLWYHDEFYNEVTRVIAGTPVTGLNVPGDQVEVIVPYSSDPGWNPAHLHGVALLERSGNVQEIYQAARLPAVPVAGAVPALPDGRELRAFPNPFSHEVTIATSGPNPGAFRLRIIDARGRFVRSLEAIAGGANVAWDGRDASGRLLPAGVYFALPGRAAGERAIRVVRIRH